MPSINVNPTDIPTPEDSSYWNAEAAAYEYTPPNPGAPLDSPDRWGWGIPLDRLACTDAVEYIICKYREEELDLYVHDPRDEHRYSGLHPKFKWPIVAAVFAHFLWFRTRPGGQWINNFFGIQEVKPFFEGYAYSWVDPNLNELHEIPPMREDQFNNIVKGTVQLRIFRQWERIIEPVITQDNLEPLDQMKNLLNSRTPTQDIRAYRNPYARRPEPWKDGVFLWVSKQLQRWFLEPKAEEHWPTHKRGRISGAGWVRSLEASPGVPVFGALSKIAAYHSASHEGKLNGPVRAYRIEDSNRRVHWCAGNEMRVIPKLDYHRNILMDKTETELQQMFGCTSCRSTRSCVPFTGREKMCCSCYAKQLEQGSIMPTLDRCTMLPECQRCTDSIDSNSRLISIKQQWNRQPHRGPIPR